MKHLNKLQVALCAAAVVVAVAFFACNKEKEQANIQQPNEAEAARKPIATKDLKTGEITFTYSINEYQELLNRVMLDRNDDGNDFVFEYIEILDNNAKSNIPELKLECSVVDVKRERSFVIWLNDEFFDIVNNGNTEKYFLKEEVENGNFSFLSYCSTGTYLITVTNHEYQAELFDTGTKSNRPPKKRQVSCQKENCQLGTCQPTNFGDEGWGCNECVRAGEQEPRCVTIIAPDDIWWRIAQLALGLPWGLMI